MQKFASKSGPNWACVTVMLVVGCSGGQADELLDTTDAGIDGGSASGNKQEPGPDDDAGPIDMDSDGGADRDAEVEEHGDASLDASSADSGAPADSGALVDAALPPCNVDAGQDATVTAKLRVTADDLVSIWFNGELVAEPTSLWQTLKEYEVAVFLYPNRKNVIAFKATNVYEQDGYDRGLVAELLYTLNGSPAYVNSDTSWKVSATLSDDWDALDFDDSGWANAVSLGPSSQPPWSSVGLNSEAQWIWSYSPSGAPSEKPDNEVNYFRKTFYMNEEGEASSEQPACQ